MMEAAEQYGATFGTNQACIGTDEEFQALSVNDKLEVVNIDAAKVRNRERYLAYAFVNCLDWGRYAGLKKELMNDYAKGKNNYPGTVLDAYNLVVNYRYDRKNPKNQSANTKGLSFQQQTRDGKPRTGLRR
jgi:hypothetical protein